MPLTSFQQPTEPEGFLKRELLITREAIRERVVSLASRISADYQGKEPVMVGVLNGVIFFFADLVREISIPLKMDFIRAASYGSRMDSCGSVTFTKDVELPIEGQDVILVEDIVDTGLTLLKVLEKLRERAPRSLRTCALIDKQERRKATISIDYCGFKVEEGFLVGYGLDCREAYRQLPDIYVLK
jgi:hypoxanthine phosphoribosyltransferase